MNVWLTAERKLKVMKDYGILTIDNYCGKLFTNLQIPFLVSIDVSTLFYFLLHVLTVCLGIRIAKIRHWKWISRLPRIRPTRSHDEHVTLQRSQRRRWSRINIRFIYEFKICLGPLNYYLIVGTGVRSQWFHKIPCALS